MKLNELYVTPFDLNQHWNNPGLTTILMRSLYVQ
jgi:hypothetical protein